ncbi:MAG: thioesterase family protein [Rhodothermales bacterium]|nr:thioesterase family protein [Rhodothermales bacterium]
MHSFDYRHRVRYRECDPMGVVYHTHYLDYFEAARTEALRQLGLPYAELERSGIRMPVIDLAVKYRRPAYYDDLLVIRTALPDRAPLAKVNIDYTVLRDEEPETVLVTGHVSLCYVDATTGRPTRAPQKVLNAFAATTRVS